MADLPIVQRAYSDDQDMLSVGLAQIHATVPGIEANKDKILNAATLFKEHGANVVAFPEFALSGYFWDERDDCLAYMREAQTEQHVDWIENELKPLLDDNFRGIVLNNVAEGPDERFYNRTLVSAMTTTTSIPKTPTTRSSSRASRRSTRRAAATTA